LTGALLAYWSLTCLVSAGFETNSINYSDLVYTRLGDRAGEVFQWLMIIYILGVITNFQITISKLLEEVLDQFNIWAISNSMDQRALQIFIFNMAIFPLACAKKLSMLRYVSMAVLAVIAYTISVIIIQAPFFIKQNTENHLWQTELVLFNMDLGALSAFSLSIFAFECHTIIFPVRKELIRPNERRMDKLIFRAIGTEFIMYALIGVLGYLSTLQNTPDLVVFRQPPNGQSDIPMTIARIIFTASLAFALPMRINPCRLQIYLLANVQDTTIKRCFITAGILLISGAIAVVFPNAYAGLTILGGTVGCLIALTLPGLIYMVGQRSWNARKIGACTITVTATLMGLTAATYTLVSTLTTNNNN